VCEQPYAKGKRLNKKKQVKLGGNKKEEAGDVKRRVEARKEKGETPGVWIPRILRNKSSMRTS